MVNWIKVGASDMLPDGPHLGARVARGKLDGRVVTCPAQGSTFDVTTGRNLTWVEGLPRVIKSMTQAVIQPKDLNTFPVKVEEGQVWIDLDADL